MTLINRIDELTRDVKRCGPLSWNEMARELLPELREALEREERLNEAVKSFLIKLSKRGRQIDSAQTLYHLCGRDFAKMRALTGEYDAKPSI